MARKVYVKQIKMEQIQISWQSKGSLRCFTLSHSKKISELSPGERYSLYISCPNTISSEPLDSAIPDITILRKKLEENFNFTTLFAVQDITWHCFVQKFEQQWQEYRCSKGTTDSTLFVQLSMHGYYCKINKDTFVQFQDKSSKEIISTFFAFANAERDSLILTISSCRVSRTSPSSRKSMYIPPSAKYAVLYSCGKGKLTQDGGTAYPERFIGHLVNSLKPATLLKDVYEEAWKKCDECNKEWCLEDGNN